MHGMSMAPQTWPGAVVVYLGMWMAMMVPMMLPSLAPMLARYRRSVRGADGMLLHSLTAVVAVGYFSVWAVPGLAAYAVSAGLTAVELRWGSLTSWLPVAAGVVMLAAGGMQFTSWKAGQIARCRGASGCRGRPLAPDVVSAWRHGLRLGVRCGLCCGSLMLALLAIGMTNLVAMVAVTIAISAERLAPAPLRIARVAGVAIIFIGVVMIARA
jgi:predicted metal-binding membrane protein